MACQADVVIPRPLEVIGEVHCTLIRDYHTFQQNARSLSMALKSLSTAHHVSRPPSVRRTQTVLLRAPAKQTLLLPGDYVQIPIPKNSDSDIKWAIEPRYDCISNCHLTPERAWPPVQSVESVGHHITLTNSTEEPVILRDNDHICQISPVSLITTDPLTLAKQPINHVNQDNVPSIPKSSTPSCGKHSNKVNVDPDGYLSVEMREKFIQANPQYDAVFNP